jgi:hypothetical protein
MIHDEKHFEILMALAVAGQLSDAELLELEQHATHCSSCVRRKSEMEAASRQLFLLNALKNKSLRTPAGMQERFLMRAIDAGVPLNLPPAGFSYPNVFRTASIAVALLIILSVGWKAVTDRHAPVTKPFANVPNAIESAPAISTASIAGRNADSYLAVSRPVKRQHHRPRSSQVQTQLPTSVSSEGNQADGKPFFTLTPAFFPRNAMLIGAAGGIPRVFNTVAADYFISSNDSPRKLPMLNISGPTLWNVSEQQSSNQRVFHYNATLASLSFLDYPSEFKSEVRVPGLSIHNAFNPIRFR